jgi:hypothetical protein
VKRTHRPALTNEQVIARVKAEGAVVVFRDSIPPSELDAWPAELWRAARARGLFLVIRDLGSILLISNTLYEHRVAPLSRVLNDLVTEDSASDPPPAERKAYPPRGRPHQRSGRVRLRLVPENND